MQETGDTPLSLAAYFGRTEVVKELVRRGADVGCRDRDGLAPGEAFEDRVDATTRRRIQVQSGVRFRISLGCWSDVLKRCHSIAKSLLRKRCASVEMSTHGAD